MRFVATLACAAIALASTAASAATIVGSPTSNSSSPNIYFNYTANDGGAFGNNDPRTYTGPGTHFGDTFIFTTAFERMATVELTSSHPNRDFSRNVNFISNGVKLNATIIPSTSTGQFERRYLANFRLPAGTSNIFVSGSSAVNGTYQGLLSLSGVPEPATWALMIVGFGLTGGAMRRRRAIGTAALA